MPQGIKGQYLIFDGGVINLRKYTGYQVRWCDDLIGSTHDDTNRTARVLLGRTVSIADRQGGDRARRNRSGSGVA